RRAGVAHRDRNVPGRRAWPGASRVVAAHRNVGRETIACLKSREALVLPAEASDVPAASFLKQLSSATERSHSSLPEQPTSCRVSGTVKQGLQWSGIRS